MHACSIIKSINLSINQSINQSKEDFFVNTFTPCPFDLYASRWIGTTQVILINSTSHSIPILADDQFLSVRRQNISW
jgi:hypothetical protein